MKTFRLGRCARAMSLSFVASSVLLLTACGDNQNDFSDVQRPTPPAPISPPPPAAQIPAFDQDGVLSANIRWTDFGVPHVTGDNLESMAFGVGYAFAQDNMCILADQIVKYNSQRAKYFGPDLRPGSGDAEHLINDFGFLTVGIRELAEKNLPMMSANSRAMLSGYTQGYNKYLADTPVAEQDPACAARPWVQPIDSVDLLTYAFGVALLPGAANFLAPMFIAAPPGVSPLPTPVMSAAASVPADVIPTSFSPKVDMPKINEGELGSNGWGLGSALTENGRGMVLANPHFPHEGNLRFWQFHAIVPGFMNVMGGSLSGLPGAVNIGFNEHVAWTHTFSTANRFVVYQLALDPNDSSRKTHLVDGNRRTIFEKPMEIEVAVAPGQTMRFRKTAYYTNYGPMIRVPGNFEWTAQNAFAIKDANLPNVDIIDQWLAMNLATSMDEFKQAFQKYNGLIFNNTMAASDDGQVFYIDSSTVPNLSNLAIENMQSNPLLVAARQAAGFPVLPGNMTLFDYERPVPFELAPKYEGNDYVQNSNDSFWLTNLESPITDVSPLYGPINNQQSLRSRMGHKFLQEGRGADNKFSATEVEELLLNNRGYLAEEVLPRLLQMCAAQGSTPVQVDGEAVVISDACNALGLWDGTMNLESVGAHVFREFAFQFNRNPQWEVPFSVEQPVSTPNTLAINDTTRQQLARAVQIINRAGIAMDAELGEVQFVERSLPNGDATGVKLPWAGAHNIEGGFNVFNIESRDRGTLIPAHNYPTLPGTIMSAEGQGYHIRYGSSWMFVMNFTEEGPKARGLLSYSQSSVFGSEHNQDQTLLYSQQPQLRDLRFSEADISANMIRELNLSSQP